MPRYTQDAFDKAFQDLMDDTCVDDLLAVPGVQELVMEHYNNDVLKLIDEQIENEKEERRNRLEDLG